MKKYINGRKYDTETAQAVGSWSNNRSYGDFSRCEETLYRKKTGEFFLHGEGGPMSRYAKSAGDNSWSGGEEIRPMTFDEAREWAEEQLDGDEYEKIFGEIGDDDTDVLISAVVKASSRDRLRRAVEKTGKTAGQILDELIEAMER
jgi:hypothetical protein